MASVSRTPKGLQPNEDHLVDGGADVPLQMEVSLLIAMPSPRTSRHLRNVALDGTAGDTCDEAALGPLLLGVTSVNLNRAANP